VVAVGKTHEPVGLLSFISLEQVRQPQDELTDEQEGGSEKD
jgi:hypothetical protein